MSTVDHDAQHVWTRTPTGIRCVFMFCNAKPNAAAIAKLATEEAARLATQAKLRWRR